MDGGEYVCDICSKKFPTQKGFKIHQNAHDSDKQYTCELCPKKFTLANRLESHIDKVHGERLHECTMCQKAFKSIDRLRVHRDKHLSEKNVLPCLACHKVFRSAGNLQKHLMKCENKIKMPNNNEMNMTTETPSNGLCMALNLSQPIYQQHG